MRILSDPIKKLPPNSKGKVRYRFVVDVGVDPETGKRKQLRRTFDSLKEAKAEYANITNRRNEGSFVPPNEITVNEWLDRWLAMKADDLEETTIYNYTIRGCLTWQVSRASCSRSGRRPGRGRRGSASPFVHIGR
ncbi:Arm DNA-binding domain-containing protein [Streptomyces sp. NPDC001093]|uniref:Arm DNA-binding domain-containing protein n=1 Tax=Streptomyces sp. NPDC001093 TaxID=3154376 RepID=UPI00332CB8C5